MESDRNRNPIQHIQTNDCFNLWRNWSGFWLIGLCNNFAYVVMLSAAQDILKKQQFKNTTTFNSSLIILDTEFENLNNGNSSYYDCSSVSTAAVLLADIFPTLIIKISAPLVIHKMPHGFRILFCVIMAATSFLVVSFSSTVWMSILGVIFASTSSGFGELTFLSLTVFYNRNVLGAWGSGTGGAGVVGALLYSILTQVGLSPQVTLLIMLIIPVTMLISYFFLLVPPPSYPQWKYGQIDNSIETSEEREPLMVGSQEEQETHSQENRRTGLLTLTEKLHTFKTLIPFVCALGVVYYAEYFINQGLMELLYFQKFFLNHAEQYRWYQTFYQVGVFISRSSLCCMKIRKLWGLALLQVLNAVLLLLEVCYKFLPNTWLVFAIIFYEGLLGGTAYVNTFYFISKEKTDRGSLQWQLPALETVWV
ncbi:battenin isoform X3 [Syngnathoides biaculeatus]|uniref:battenin isoform X3 n=1 Tax=Syngnathoides biaculeatus TaxID=300417 RepID=UPI002ADD8A8B|nr:battenin isoform X3 [Syngnathoides biaculeatus]